LDGRAKNPALLVPGYYAGAEQSGLPPKRKVMCCFYFLDAGALLVPVLLLVGSGTLGFFSGMLFFFVSTMLVFQLLLKLWILVMDADRDDNRMRGTSPLLKDSPGGGDVPNLLSSRLPFGRIGNKFM